MRWRMHEVACMHLDRGRKFQVLNAAGARDKKRCTVSDPAGHTGSTSTARALYHQKELVLRASGPGKETVEWWPPECKIAVSTVSSQSRSLVLGQEHDHLRVCASVASLVEEGTLFINLIPAELPPHPLLQPAPSPPGLPPYSLTCPATSFQGRHHRAPNLEGENGEASGKTPVPDQEPRSQETAQGVQESPLLLP